MAAAHDLVARSEALGNLRDALDRTAASHGHLALVRGEPGIGKSALVNVIARDAHDRGFAVVSGRAWELAEAPPYFPLWPCFRALGIPTQPDANEEGGGEGTKGAKGTNPFRVWEDVLAALARASADKPIVWILEDIHAADLQTLDLLTFLVQPLHSLRVLVVATARKQDPRITERVGQRLVRMARDGLDIELAPLSETEVAELAARILGRVLPSSATKQLVELTNGNPLFVVECARAFRVTGAAPVAVVSLPPTVRQVVIDRVALLPEATRRVLERAAVLGREASAAMLARMQSTLPANVIDAMLPALDAGIVNELRPGHFAFTHILVRDAIEFAIAPAERARLHASIEAVLAAISPAGPEILVERARHALASMRMDGSAIELASRAATMLEELGAFDRALAMHERIEEARAAGLGPEAPISERLHIARVAQQAGRHAKAGAICEQVLASARANRDGELLARAALVLGAEIRPATVDPVLVASLEEAMVALGETAPTTATTAATATRTPTPLGCRVLARLAAALQPSMTPQVPAAMARDAIARARRIDEETAGSPTRDSTLLLDVLHTALAALVDYVPTRDRREIEEELYMRAMDARDLPKALRARIVLAMGQAEAGDFGAWDTSVDQALDLSIRIGAPRYRWRALLLASMRSLARGDVSEADRYVVEAEQLAALTDDPALMLSLNAHLGGRVRLLHRDDEMRELMAHLESLFGNVPNARYILLGGIGAGVYATLEDRDGARRALAIMHETEMPDEETAFFIAFEALATALVGDESECKRLRKKIERYMSAQISGGHVEITYCGPVDRVVAILDSRLGDHESALRLLRNALTVMTERGLRPWMAQIHYDLGNALRRASRRSDADPIVTDKELEAEALRHFSNAARLGEEIGMPGLVLRARAATTTTTTTTTKSPSSAEVNESTTSIGAWPAIDGAKRSRGASATTPIGSGPGMVGIAPVVMVHEGDTWRVDHAGHSVRVKDNRGMQLLARLVAQPGEEIHVLVLASDDAGGVSVHDEGTGDVLLDPRARREYKERLDDLDSEIAEAERNNDAGRTERLRNEKASLEAELHRALGLGGRARAVSGSASERARVNVQRRLKDAIARIAEHDATIGRFLEKTIRTGTYCRFFV